MNEIITSGPYDETCECSSPQTKKNEVEAYDKEEIMSVRPPDIPIGAKTSDYYKVAEDLPFRFNEPDQMKAYDRKPMNPMYRTTNSEYGRIPPNVHTMNVVYHKRKRDFTKRYMECGNYRNHSLNTALDKSKVLEM
ncbi:unnamed protein product [Dicrocoelium dendriticum]|nr:unnamed protein product [Dicrocoelium dendriticum]